LSQKFEAMKSFTRELARKRVNPQKIQDAAELGMYIKKQRF